MSTALLAGLIILGNLANAGAQSTVTLDIESEVKADGCPLGTLLEDETNECLALVDARPAFPPPLRTALPPNLGTKRWQHHGSRVPARATALMPVPGGVGAGVSYKVGQLKAGTWNLFRTYMAVHPSGLNNTFDWIFTTATNRTQKGVEVLASYEGGGARRNHISIFDWSCSSASPCAGGYAQPAYVFSVPISSFNACYKTSMADGGGHFHTFVRYGNETSVSPAGVYSNIVTFRNFCNNTWEVVYRHDYGGTQLDCSLGFTCGWWGPIIETFSDTPWTLEEVAFVGSQIFIDGTAQNLTPANTNWDGPKTRVPPLPWTTFHRVANHNWGVGGTPCDAPRCEGSPVGRPRVCFDDGAYSGVCSAAGGIYCTNGQWLPGGSCP